MAGGCLSYTPLPYRERIARYILVYQMSHDNHPVLASDMYRELFQKYPKFVNFRMVSHVLRNRNVFEEVLDLGKNKYGRIYKIRDGVYKLRLNEMLRLLLG